MLEQLTIVFAYASFAGITLYGHALLLKAVWRHPEPDQAPLGHSAGAAHTGRSAGRDAARMAAGIQPLAGRGSAPAGSASRGAARLSFRP